MPKLPRPRLPRRSPFPSRALNEVRLLHEVSRAYPDLAYADLSTENLARVTQERGVDFATALFYDRIRRSCEHGRFITQVEALEPPLDALPAIRGKLLVAPAAFYQEFPDSGGDGLLVREIATEFGMEAGLIPVRSMGSVTLNAARIRETLAKERDGSVVLVSLSKGGADVRLALAEGGPAPAKVRAWVQICGLIRGSPVVDALLDAPWWRQVLARGYLASMGARFGALQDLRHGTGSLLAQPAHAPPGVPVINVIGCPLSSHLTSTVRVRHRRLATLGPNDGSTPLRAAILEPGLVYPVWGADHYFRVPQVSRLLYRLFLYLAQQDDQPLAGDRRGEAP